MLIDSFDTDKQVLVIAEIGNNHEGSFNLAEELITRAAEAGADAVKLQTIRAEFLINSSNKIRLSKLKSFELSFKEFKKLSKVAADCGVIFLSTPFDIEAAEFLDSIVPAFKISSGDNNFYPLIEKVASFGKPILLSSGLADLKQLSQTKKLIEDIWSGLDVEPGLAILHCVSKYPVMPAEANLKAIHRIQDELGCVAGYSDHTLGIDAAVLSVALGARVVEKHFTIDKNYSEFRDHQLSADPKDMRKLVASVRLAEEFLGGAEKFDNCQDDNSTALRRSIVARCNLKGGKIITMDDIIWVRPGGGINPGDEEKVLGKTLTRSIDKGQMILAGDIEE